MVTHTAFPGAFGRRTVDMMASRRPLLDDGALRPLDVDMEELELSARDASAETQSFLDVETGAVLVMVKGEPDEAELRARVRGDRNRYPRIPPFGLAEERGLLRQFLSMRTDGPGRDLLMRLVDAPGAFHACLTALKADEVLWRAWERYEAQGLRGSLLGWMATQGVQPRLMMSALVDD